MRRSFPVWSLPAVPLLAALAAACGASQDPQPAAPLASTPPPAPSPPALLAHAPAPPPPPGIETASLDTSTSPCDDFYQYACGGWLKANPIPDDQVAWSRTSVLDEQNVAALRAILDRDAKAPNGDPYAKQLGDFYTSCMDEDAAEKAGARPLAPELKRIDAVHDAVSLAHELARLHALDVHAFFEIGSDQDYKDATQVIAAIEQSGIGLPDRDYYLNDDASNVELRAKYATHVEHLLGLLGEKPELAKKDTQAVLALEKTLATGQMNRTDHRDPDKMYHPTDRAGIGQVAPTLPWDAYLKDLGMSGVKAFNVYEPDFLAAADKVIAGATKATWSDQIRPYLRVRLARRYASRLDKRFVDEDFTFTKALSGQEKLEPRWKRCTREVDEKMGEALAIPFVKATLGEDGKKAARDMVQSIEAAMEKDLGQLPWMDDATRALAMDKVHKLTNKIGYPDRFRSYDALKVERGSYVSNVMRASEFEMRRRLAKIGKPLDRTEWQMTPPTVNAYFNPSMNEMVFPAGILQPPFFSATSPATTSFGGIGVIMGHELTHAFDDQGRKFDGDGNMKDWWTSKVGEEFDRRTACVADQFSGYTATDDVHVNGKLTMGENIADLGGLKLALASIHAKSPATAEGDRQFFLGHAQANCSSWHPELTRMLTQTDPHAPDKWRVDGPMSNMADFAKAFSCQAGDAMVRAPEKQCTVW